jgi:hypothetical protein
MRKTLTDKGVLALKLRAARYSHPDPEQRGLYVAIARGWGGIIEKMRGRGSERPATPRRTYSELTCAKNFLGRKMRF